MTCFERLLCVIDFVAAILFTAWVRCVCDHPRPNGRNRATPKR